MVSALGPIEDKTPHGQLPQGTEVKLPAKAPLPIDPVCSCDEEEKPKAALPDVEAEQLIAFEDALQNIIYVR